MDIPLVLEKLRPGVHWGSMAQTGKTYAELKKGWPKANGALPTEAKMEAEWKIIKEANEAKKTDTQVQSDMNTLLAGVPDANTKKILKALMFEMFKKDEGALKRHGINIER